MHKLFFDAALLPQGWRNGVVATVEDGRFTAIEADAPPTVVAGAERAGGVAVPGIANLHSHTFQRGFAGLTERRGPGDDHFWTWRDAMYRWSRTLGPEDVEALAGMAFVEMLESGFTGVGEFHYLHHAPDGRPYDDPAELSARVAAAAETTGIGLTLLPVFYAHGGFGTSPPAPGQARFICDLDLFSRVVEGATKAVSRLPGGGWGIAPHSLRAVEAGELAALVARYDGRPVHIHVAEQEREVADCLAFHGARPVEWLLDHAPVDARWCLVHATHMTETETARVARLGAVVGLCPITESDLGDGIFPAAAFCAAGGAFGVGSDSNVLISLAAELRTLEYSQRLRDRARNRLAEPGGSTGRFLFERAAAGGARALGRPAPAIAPGCRADFVVVDGNSLELVERRGDALLDGWIFASARSPVRSVFAGGRGVVREGRHVARHAIETAFRRTIARLAD